MVVHDHVPCTLRNVVSVCADDANCDIYQCFSALTVIEKFLVSDDLTLLEA